MKERIFTTEMYVLEDQMQKKKKFQSMEEKMAEKSKQSYERKQKNLGKYNRRLNIRLEELPEKEKKTDGEESVKRYIRENFFH